MRITQHTAVSIDYRLTNDAGELLDQSSAGAPLVYLHGTSNLITGLETALEGKTTGDTFTVTIAPEDAYGAFQPELLGVLERSIFEGVDTLEVGMQFQAATADGSPQIVTIRALEGDQVTVDANHPLAGQQLTFTVTVLSVRAAEAAEIAHGHIHGAGGHHH